METNIRVLSERIGLFGEPVFENSSDDYEFRIIDAINDLRLVCNGALVHKKNNVLTVLMHFLNRIKEGRFNDETEQGCIKYLDLANELLKRNSAAGGGRTW